MKKLLLLLPIIILEACNFTSLNNANPQAVKPLVYQLDWANNEEIIFSGNIDKESEVGLYTMNINTKEVKLFMKPFTTGFFSVSPDKTKLSYSTDNNDKKEIRIINLKDKSEKVSVTFPQDPNISIGDVEFIPNSTKLVFSKKINNSFSALYTVDEDGKNEQKILSSPDYNYNIESVSKDGKKILFSTDQAPLYFKYQLYSGDITNLNDIKIKKIADDNSSGFFGKDNEIYLLKKEFLSPVFFNSIYKYNTQTEQKTRLNNNDYYESFKVNYENNKAAFVTRKDNNVNEIYISSPDGTNELKLTNYFSKEFK